MDVGNDFAFLKEFLPEVMGYLDSSIIDLNQYSDQMSPDRGESKSVLEDYEFFRKAKLKFNITL